MSDDDYYDDEYADFHDMLFDADPDPDFADDLAERATYSPVWFDNPNEEARDYFSDWEYYSDDYFDDDPMLLSNLSKSQIEGRSISQHSRHSTKRGRKRKLSEAREIATLGAKEMGALEACIKGTVWKVQSPEPAESYKGGVAKPVALRLSKAIMKSAYSMKQGFGRGGLTRDESWANDLSLADMGLKTDTSVDRQQEPRMIGNDEAESTSDGDVADKDEEEDENVEEMTDLTGLDLYHGQSSTTFSLLKSTRSRPETMTQSGKVQAEDIDDPNDRHSPRKRQKVNGSESDTESRNTLNTPGTSLSTEASETAMEAEPKRGSGSVKQSKGENARQHESVQKQTDRYSENPTAFSRKRKLSDVEGVVSTPTAGTDRATKVAKSSVVSHSSNTSKRDRQ